MAMLEEIQTLTNSFLELAPGVPATPGNLKTLLSYILRIPGISNGWCIMSNDITVQIKKSGKKELRVVLDSPPPRSQLIVTHHVPVTEDGLLEAFVLLKKSIHKYRTEGMCEACQPPKKRLKADGMPKCEECMITEAIGL